MTITSDDERRANSKSVMYHITTTLIAVLKLTLATIVITFTSLLSKKKKLKIRRKDHPLNEDLTRKYQHDYHIYVKYTSDMM
jgi:hypothetical protein